MLAVLRSVAARFEPAAPANGCRSSAIGRGHGGLPEGGAPSGVLVVSFGEDDGECDEEPYSREKASRPAPQRTLADDACPPPCYPNPGGPEPKRGCGPRTRLGGRTRGPAGPGDRATRRHDAHDVRPSGALRRSGAASSGVAEVP